MGIIEQVKHSETKTVFEPLTVEKLEEIVYKLYDDLYSVKEPEIVLYTGWIGKLTFDFAIHGNSFELGEYIYLQRAHNLGVKERRQYSAIIYKPNKFRQSNIVIFDLFIKNGLYKAIYNYKTSSFKIMKGTSLMFTTTDLDHNTLKKIKDIEALDKSNQYENRQIIKLQGEVK